MSTPRHALLVLLPHRRAERRQGAGRAPVSRMSDERGAASVSTAIQHSASEQCL